MPLTPHAPIATNHTIITGPKNRPTAAVPWRCTENSADDDHRGDRHDEVLEVGVDDLEPLDRDSTEIAGVIMLSPKNSAAPNRPSAGQHHRGAPPRACRSTAAAA